MDEPAGAAEQLQHATTNDDGQVGNRIVCCSVSLLVECCSVDPGWLQSRCLSEKTIGNKKLGGHGPWREAIFKGATGPNRSLQGPIWENEGRCPPSFVAKPQHGYQNKNVEKPQHGCQKSSQKGETSIFSENIFSDRC